MHTGRILEYGDNVIFVDRSKAFTIIGPPIRRVGNDEGEGWPVAHILPDRRPVCAEELQIETAWE